MDGQHLQREAQWQKRQVIKRWWLNSLLYDAPAFEGVRNSMLAHLEAVPDAWALDLGCGEGRDLMSLTYRGMRVVGVDLSWAQLRLAKERMGEERSSKTAILVQADAAALPFPPETFHLVFGKAVLHHNICCLEVVLKEIIRVLRHKGYISFAEPMASHPLFRLGRHLTPHMRSADERPFRLDDFYRVAALFEKCEIEFWFLLAPLAYILRLLPRGEQMFQKLHAGLSRLDRWLFQRIPALHAWAWYGVIRARKCEGPW